MFVIKKRGASELSEANCHARLSRSKQLVENIHPIMLASFSSQTQGYLQWPHLTTHRIIKSMHLQ